MSIRPKLYLAGPEVFLPAANEIGRCKKALCAKFGFEGLYPLDNDIIAGARDARLDRLIYRANLAMIQTAHAGIFNLTPFRGPSADAGTVFELGLMTGLGKPAFAYTNDGGSLLERMQREGAAVSDPATRRWRDRNGAFIEDYGNIDNLMIDGCLTEHGEDRRVQSASDKIAAIDDLSSFIECLKRVHRHFVNAATPAKRPSLSFKRAASFMRLRICPACSRICSIRFVAANQILQAG